jgi:benzoyl-CoA reductase/2-hydroxyglutaryl-CoA dehydratase subunit BcrC/BadD/HgdB
MTPQDSPNKRRHATEAAAKVPGLVREMMAAPQRAHEAGNPVAYTFIQSCYDEIIHAMGITPAWVENFAGVCGAKRVAIDFLERAETEYFSRSLCTYALCSLGFDAWRQETGETPPPTPWGGLPKPDMMLGTGGMICDPRYKWFQATQMYLPDVPVAHVNIPYPPFQRGVNHHHEMGHYVKYIVSELRGLIAFLEKHTGRKMDYDALAARVDLTDRTINLCWETYDLRRAAPTPMGTGDAFNTMVPLNFMLATQESHDFFLDLRNELRERVDAGLGAVPKEKYRLLWGGGLAAWFALNDFEYFAELGAAFPAEVSYRLAEHIDHLELPQTDDPVEHIAWRWVKYHTYWYDKAQARANSQPDVEKLIQFIEDYRIDGVVMHEAFSCRTWHPGLIWQLNHLKKIYRDIPTLVLESDRVDISSYNEANTRNMIDAFIDIIDAEKEA